MFLGRRGDVPERTWRHGNRSGIRGRDDENRRYQEVCTGRTGHAGGIRLLYDPGVVTYEDLLATFWSIHDPTQKNRKGPDIGTNYRSVIFYHTPDQKQIATRSKVGIERSAGLKDPLLPRSSLPRSSGVPRDTTSSTTKSTAGRDAGSYKQNPATYVLKLSVGNDHPQATIMEDIANVP